MFVSELRPNASPVRLVLRKNHKVVMALRGLCVCLLILQAQPTLAQMAGAAGGPAATMGGAGNANQGGAVAAFGASPPPRPFTGAPGALNFNMGGGFYGRSLSAPAAAPVYSYSGASGAAAGSSGGAPRMGAADDFNSMGDMR